MKPVKFIIIQVLIPITDFFFIPLKFSGIARFGFFDFLWSFIFSLLWEKLDHMTKKKCVLQGKSVSGFLKKNQNFEFWKKMKNNWLWGQILFRDKRVQKAKLLGDNQAIETKKIICILFVSANIFGKKELHFSGLKQI